MISRKIITNIVREEGFDLVGITRAEHLDKEHNRFNEWMLEGNTSTLDYLKRNIEKRFDASILVEGARSVVVCAISYLSPYSRGYEEGCRTKVASYALARDYHLTIKEMLTKVAERLKEHYPTLRFRAFTDSAPLAEKSYAVRAGLGWIGKNHQLIHPMLGSLVHPGEIVLNKAVIGNRLSGIESRESDIGQQCTDCHLCLDACPTGALRNNVWDARECIAYTTHHCLECQNVCPHNKQLRYE
jgi:epoxyqueuosine reductase